MPRLAVADRPGIHPDASAACTWLAFDSLPPIRPPYLRHLPTHPHTPGATGPPYATHIATRINHMALLHTAAIAFPFQFPISPAGPSPRGRAIAIASAYMTSWTFSALSVELCRIGAPCAARPYACPKPLEFVSSWCISKYTYARIDCIGDTPTPVFGEPSCIVFICCVMLSRHVNMVAIAQLVEHLIVVQKVARSSRVSHPRSNPEIPTVSKPNESRGFLVSVTLGNNGDPATFTIPP